MYQENRQNRAVLDILLKNIKECPSLAEMQSQFPEPYRDGLSYPVDLGDCLLRPYSNRQSNMRKKAFMFLPLLPNYGKELSVNIKNFRILKTILPFGEGRRK